MSYLFGKALHVAFVVPSVDREIERLLALGIGPIFLMRRIRVAARYRGERHDPLLTAAFAWSGELFLEFLETHDATPSGMQEYLDGNPDGGLHHFAYFSDDFDRTLADLAARGKPFEVVQEYIDEAGVPYEIYVKPAGAPDGLMTQLVHRGPLEELYNQMRAAAHEWDGKDPIRRAADLLPPELRPLEEA